MTDKEMAMAIAEKMLRFQVRQIASDTLLSRFRVDGRDIDWRGQLRRDMDHDLAPESPYAKRVEHIESELQQANQSEVLATLFRELFQSKVS